MVTLLSDDFGAALAIPGGTCPGTPDTPDDDDREHEATRAAPVAIVTEPSFTG